jgi:hypothetical protein
MNLYRSELEYDVFYWDGSNINGFKQWLHFGQDIRVYEKPEYYEVLIKEYFAEGDGVVTRDLLNLEKGTPCYVVYDDQDESVFHLAQYSKEVFENLFRKATENPF